MRAARTRRSTAGRRGASRSPSQRPCTRRRGIRSRRSFDDAQQALRISLCIQAPDPPRTARAVEAPFSQTTRSAMRFISRRLLLAGAIFAGPGCGADAPAPETPEAPAAVSDEAADGSTLGERQALIGHSFRRFRVRL